MNLMREWAANLGVALRSLHPDSIRSQPLGNFKDDSAFVDFWGGAPTAAGVRVTEETAMAFSAVYRCVSLISGTLASMPVCVSKVGEKGPKKLDGHPIDELWNVAPNDEQTPYTVKEALFAHALLQGVGYAEIVHNKARYPQQVIPLETSRVEPKRDKAGRLYYEVRGDNGAAPTILDSSEMLVIPNICINGRPMSTVGLAREGIGLGLSAEQYGATFFGNGQIPAGVLTTKEKLQDAARKNMRASWAELHKRKAGEIAILEQGTEYKQISIPPEDAQFLGTREFQVVDICRWFGVSPYMLGVMKGAGSIDVEAMGDEFKTYTLLPWTVRFNQECRRKLIMPRERAKTFVWMDTTKVLRAGFEKRVRTHSLAIQSGLRPINECRGDEDWEPLPQPEADRALIPLNLGQGGVNNAPNDPLAGVKDKGKQSTTQDDPNARVGPPPEQK